MSSHQSLISTIQSVASGSTLNIDQKKLIDQLNTMILNYQNEIKSIEYLKNASFGTATKQWIQQGNYTVGGNIVFTGIQEFTGTVNVITQVKLDNQMEEVHGADVLNLSIQNGNDYVISLPLSGNELGNIKSLYQVNYGENTSMSSIKILAVGAIENGVVRKFTLILPYNDNNHGASFPTASLVDDQYVNVVALNDVPSTPTVENFARQEITVWKVGNVVRLFSTVTYF